MPPVVEAEVDVDHLPLSMASHFPAGYERTWVMGHLERIVRAEASWLDTVETDLPLDELIATQNELNRAGLWTAYRGQPDFYNTKYPQVIRFRHKLYVWDGHHRLAIRRARGYRSMVCRLLDADCR